MATLLRTVENLIDEVRQQVDEQNRDSVDSEQDILPSLNRAQDYGFDILARRYQEPILAYSTLVLQSGVSEYDIPEDVFEDRIQKLEVIVAYDNNKATYREIKRVSYRDLTDYESNVVANMPDYYCIIGRKIRLVNPPTGTYNIRMWYLRNPERLCMPQGRITVSNTAGNYVVVDSAGDKLSTESDKLESYVNIVDGQTGIIKGTLQIQVLSENKITFRSSPTRSSVLNRVVSGSLSAVGATLDDYISPVEGTCVPYFGKPLSNFLIQFAVAEITRKLGGSADMEERVLEKFEKQVERTWAGREVQLRVKKSSNIWPNGIRRYRWWQ